MIILGIAARLSLEVLKSSDEEPDILNESQKGSPISFDDTEQNKIKKALSIQRRVSLNNSITRKRKDGDNEAEGTEKELNFEKQVSVIGDQSSLNSSQLIYGENHSNKMRKVDLDAIQYRIENTISTFFAEFMKRIEGIESSINGLQNQDRPNRSVELIYEDGCQKINLLSYNCTSMSKYTTMLMEVLFTKNEMAQAYIVEGISTSQKKPLCKKKLQLLYDAVILKYNIDESKREKVIQNVKKVAKSKCNDTRRQVKNIVADD